MDPHPFAPSAPPLPAVPRTRNCAGPTPPGAHTITTSERGSFCLAVCSCGWRGPARRSRDLARKDASGHLTG
ncbi:hypothetical protein ACIQWR_24700 [Streptomyces sp. NPDC098789]|uniref:hypothetical protein n=1 Tax=Streptomyces sp. NPDC098789 TaxID=3366098 RepID=UPI003804AEA7